MLLHGGLHDQMVLGCQHLGIDEIVGQGRRLALEPPEQTIGEVGHLLFAACAVGHQHVAGVAKAEYRLDPGRDIIGE